MTRDIARGRKSAEQIRREQDRLTTATARMGERLSAEGGRTAVSPPAVRAERDFVNSHALAFDPHGRLWVRTSRGAIGETIFDLFSAAGAYLGEVEVNAEIGMFALNAGYLVGTVRGAVDEPIVTVWRVFDNR